MKYDLINGFRVYVKGGRKNENAIFFNTSYDCLITRHLECTLNLADVYLDIWKNGCFEVLEMPF